MFASVPFGRGEMTMDLKSKAAAANCGATPAEEAKKEQKELTMVAYLKDHIGKEGVQEPPEHEVLTLKVIAAYCLATLGAKTSPTAEDVKNILESVGAEADGEKIEFLLAELKAKGITEVIAAGREKFASVPSGRGEIAMAALATAAGDGGAPAEEAKK